MAHCVAPVRHLVTLLIYNSRRLLIMSMREMALEYVELVTGHGQCVHPAYGPSHHMLAMISAKYGKKAVYTEIQKIFVERLLRLAAEQVASEEGEGC